MPVEHKRLTCIHITLLNMQLPKAKELRETLRRELQKLLVSYEFNQVVPKQLTTGSLVVFLFPSHKHQYISKE